MGNADVFADAETPDTTSAYQSIGGVAANVEHLGQLGYREHPRNFRAVWVNW